MTKPDSKPQVASFRHPLTLSLILLLAGVHLAQPAASPPPVFPGEHWQEKTPAELGLDPVKLQALSELVQGEGCVVRHGYLAYAWNDIRRSHDVASAFKPLLSTLLLLAIQENRIPSVDSRVVEVEPRLADLNGGKDAAMTWRHLASQMSGYGLEEAPGQAYAYNDYAITLYYDTLMQKVFRQPGTEVLRRCLGQPLQFEDRHNFEAFGPNNRPGRLALSVRDFARFGLLILRGGRWGDRQLIEPYLLHTALHSPVPPHTPLTSGRASEMLPGQRTMGGNRNITPVGPGFYSFNWWINGTNASGQRIFPAAGPDTLVASGHGGQRTLWIFPSLDLIVCWNDSPIDDHDASPGNPGTRCNQAVQLMVDSARPLETPLGTGLTQQRFDLGVQGASFTRHGQPFFLAGISDYGALGASRDFLQQDLQDLHQLGISWIRVWATWAAFDHDVSAVDHDGHTRFAQMEKLAWLVDASDRLGIAVDVTLSRGNGVTGPIRLQSQEAHLRAVSNLVVRLRPWRNWYLDLSNERNIGDSRFTSFEDLGQLRALVRDLDPARLVTASQGGDISRKEVRDYLQVARVDFLTPHRPRHASSPSETQEATRNLLAWAKEVAGQDIPVHYQEPFRRGYGSWEPSSDDFLKDLKAAVVSGAAGWCLHNGSTQKSPGERPRRSFDLRESRLMDQLDSAEKTVLEQLKSVLPAPSP